MRNLARGLVVLLGLWIVSGTALNLSRHPHWYVRGWDFPRTVVAGLALAAGVPYAVFFWRGASYDWAFLVLLGAAFLWQVWNILPYTALGPRAVQWAERPSAEGTFRLVVSNVLQENTDHVRWLRVVRAARPDLVLALEVDRRWDGALRELEQTHPYVVRRVQDNHYGMALLSRLPLRDTAVRFLVQDDVPSIEALVELPSGARVSLHGLHPRPPEPRSGQDSAPRDAELMILARRLGDGPPRPTVVAGDLNDVAWSHTTHLFLRRSGLLDPRLGRGFLNTFDANSRVFRFPLDHVFHSGDFRLVELRRLPHVGSDHFPVLIALSHEPEAAVEQEVSEPGLDDEREADEKIGRAHASGAVPARDG